MAQTRTALRLMDIAPNLTDPMFQGIYRGKKVHESDLHLVVERAASVGVCKMMVTGSSLGDARSAYKLAQTFSTSAPTGCQLFSTVGCHPCHADDFEKPENGSPDEYVASMAALIEDDIAQSTSTGAPRRIVAVGECGLDFDRENFCAKEVQIRHYERHFTLTERFGLPLFLHDRNTGGIFHEMTLRNRHRFKTGVVHSFTGTVAEMNQYIDLGLYIGVNGCSLRTAEGLEAVRQLPLERIMLETDAPWCEIRPSHASSELLSDFDASILPASNKKEKFVAGSAVRSRCEPVHIRQVLHVVARVKGVTDEEVAAAAWNNTQRVFFPNEKS